LSAPVAPTCVLSTSLANVATSLPSTSVGADTRPTYVSLGVPLTSAPPTVDTKAVSSVATTASAPPPLPPVSQDPGTGGPIPSSGTVSSVAAPTIIVKQPEPVRPYIGQSSYKAYKECFERICLCNECKSPTECARHLLVAMDGAATDAVRGLKAEKDTDLALIWEALSRHFGHVDEPERAMRRFDVRRQQDGETLTLFEQNLRILHREAWPKTDIKSPEADSLLRRKFVDGIADIELQKYLRLHAANDDFATTVSKARQFVDANELSRTAKKPAIRSSPNVNYQTIVDAVSEVLDQRERDHTVNVNTVQNANCAMTDNRNKKASPRQGSPAPSNSSAGSASSRASSPARTVRFQDQVESGYGESGKGRWQGNQSPQGNNSPRPWAGQRPQGQRRPSHDT